MLRDFDEPDPLTLCEVCLVDAHAFPGRLYMVDDGCDYLGIASLCDWHAHVAFALFTPPVEAGDD